LVDSRELDVLSCVGDLGGERIFDPRELELLSLVCDLGGKRSKKTGADMLYTRVK
jgi:hypothetical protein